MTKQQVNRDVRWTYTAYLSNGQSSCSNSCEYAMELALEEIGWWQLSLWSQGDLEMSVKDEVLMS